MTTPGPDKVFMYMWEYIVQEISKEDFERAYGPDGDWVQLFKKNEGYLFTELHRDVSNPVRYITMDYWKSKKARDDFRIRFSQAFEALDQRCEAFTEKEVFLGDFKSFGVHLNAPGNES